LPDAAPPYNITFRLVELTKNANDFLAA
jgi:hypothetical protein